MPNEEPEKGDKVSWNWSGGQPSGKVVETKTEGEIAIKSKRGNTIKKNASPSNPAVHVGRSGNDVVKRASELMVDEKASGSGSGAKENGDKKREHSEIDGDEDEAAEGGEEGGDKAAEEKAAEEKEEKEEEEVKKPEAKKQKKETAASKKKKAAAAATEEKKAAPAEKKKEKKQANGDGGEAKKGRGRPKGTGTGTGGAAGGKKKRDAKPRATEGIGSRTRSRA